MKVIKITNLICRYKTKSDNVHGLSPMEMVLAIQDKIPRKDIFILDCASIVGSNQIRVFINKLQIVAKKYRKLRHRIFRYLLYLNGSKYSKKPFVILNEFASLPINWSRELNEFLSSICNIIIASGSLDLIEDAVKARCIYISNIKELKANLMLL